MHVVNLAAGLDPARFRTRLIAGRITDDEGDMTYYARDRGVDVVEIAGMSRLLSPWNDLGRCSGCSDSFAESVRRSFIPIRRRPAQWFGWPQASL